jgi:hypothetical protein
MKDASRLFRQFSNFDPRVGGPGRLYSAAMSRMGAAVLLGLIAGGCARIDRTITVTSNPVNALVFLNDQEIGRTPVTRTFKWYGTYDVEVRKDGYETLKTTAPVIAPWWQFLPFDFAAEFVPGTHEDHREFHYTLREPIEREVDPAQLVRRGEELKARLESGQRTIVPQTRPTTRPEKRAATSPTTQSATH